MQQVSEQEKIEYRDRLVQFANDIGFDVEIDSKMEDQKKRGEARLRKALDSGKIDESEYNEAITKECRPAGDCDFLKRMIRVREGKSYNGQIATLIHELSHALAFGGFSMFSSLGEQYNELACESITEFVTQFIGINRTKKTSRRIVNYGFGSYLVSPATLTVSNIFLDVLGKTSNESQAGSHE